MCRLATAASLNCIVAPLRTIPPNRCRHGSLQASTSSTVRPAPALRNDKRSRALVTSMSRTTTPSSSNADTAAHPSLATRYRAADGRASDNRRAAGSSAVGVRLSQVLAGLSYALDLTEGQRPGHSIRSCLIGMRIAEVINLPREERSALFYALLMKDLGARATRHDSQRSSGRTTTI
jgi:hypothetical protein